MRRIGRAAALSGAALAALLAISGCSFATAPVTNASPSSSLSPADEATAQQVRDVITAKMAEWGLQAVIVEATKGGHPLISQAFGASMTGVPASIDMHFRNGAVAISYVATALLLEVQDGKVALTDPLSTWLPEVPNADRVTIGELAQMTAGYADYLWSPELLGALETDPFRQWSPEELTEFGTSKPLLYQPGTNWNYSHTDYVLLGLALEKITGKPIDQLLEERVLGPLGLNDTRDAGSAAMPDPVLHAYTSERRGYLGVPDGVPFIEDSTFWNPSWTITRGAVQYTDIADLTRTARAIGTGELLTPELHAEQLNTRTRGFATALPGCPACFPHSEIYTYGLGVVQMGHWILQNPMFNGFAAVEAYLPEGDVTISVAVTFHESAFDASGGVSNRATDLFRALSSVVAPGTAPPTRQ